MKGITKCILSSVFSRPSLFALLLISSLVLSSLSPLVANAATDYGVQTTDELNLGGQGSAMGCYEDGTDMTLQWGQIMQDASGGFPPYSYQNTWNYQSNFDSAQTKLTNFVNRFRDSLYSESATGWAVSQASLFDAYPTSSEDFDTFHKMIRIWAFDPDTELTLRDGYLQADSGNLYYTDYFLNPNADCRWQALNYGEVSTTTMNFSSNKFLFVNAKEIHYPEDYTGNPIPNGVNTKTTVRPDFTYSVNNKDVQAKDYNQTLPTITPDEGYTIQGYSVEWSLFKCGSYTDVGNICNDPDLVKEQILPQDDYFNYSVSDYGDYHLKAQYLVQQCYRYPSYPATPDYCFYVDFGAESELDDYDFTSTTVRLKIDGSSFSGDTKEGECGVSGFCEPPSPYEDCSTYGLDVVGGLGCVIRNFGVWLTNTLKMLFIPTGQFFKELFDDFNSFFIKKLGFIAYPITFLIGFFTDVMNAAASPNCAIEGGSLFGVNADIDLCKMQNNIPQIYNGIIVFIRAAVAFTLIFALFRKYHEVIGEGGKA